MKNTLRLLGAIMMVVAPALALASGPSVDQNQTQPLPVKGMLAAVKNGKIAFVSDNGRFVFQGRLYDTWSQKDVTTLEEAKRANDYLELKKLKFNVDELSPHVIGSGDKTIVVFYDPYCPTCKDLMADAQQEQGYVFKFVAIPVMGPESTKAVRYAHCTSDKENAVKVLLGKVLPKDIPDDKFEMCDTTSIAKRVVSTQLFGLQGVPFIVRDDGLIRSGYVKGQLSNWLMAE